MAGGARGGGDGDTRRHRTCAFSHALGFSWLSNDWYCASMSGRPVNGPARQSFSNCAWKPYMCKNRQTDAGNASASPMKSYLFRSRSACVKHRAPEKVSATTPKLNCEEGLWLPCLR